MKHISLLITLLFVTVLSLSAQNNYSPCYMKFMAEGNALYDMGNYKKAKASYSKAMKCNGGNPAEAKKKIKDCDAKIVESQDNKKKQEGKDKESKEEAMVKETDMGKADSLAAMKQPEISGKEIVKEEKVAPRSAEQLQEEETKRQMMEDKRMEAMCKSLKDYDGNKYALIQIGSQCWMAENLRTTHFADGTEIPLGKSYPTLWFNPVDFSRYYPDNNKRNVSTYGFLYDWATVMYGESSSKSNPSGVQGICPTGWHVPSEEEWNQLQQYLAAQSQYSCEGKTKNTAKALAATTGWKESKVSCSPGNMMQENNVSGFNALPAGRYNPLKTDYINSGPAYFTGEANYWTATAEKPSLDPYGARMIQIGYNDKAVRHGVGGQNPKAMGYSVRCVRD